MCFRTGVQLPSSPPYRQKEQAPFRFRFTAKTALCLLLLPFKLRPTPLGSQFIFPLPLFDSNPFSWASIWFLSSKLTDPAMKYQIPQSLRLREFFSLIYHVFRALSFFAFAEIATPSTALLNANKRHFTNGLYCLPSSARSS